MHVPALASGMDRLPSLLLGSLLPMQLLPISRLLLLPIFNMALAVRLPLPNLF